jgi:hypothetical protein
MDSVIEAELRDRRDRGRYQRHHSLAYRRRATSDRTSPSPVRNRDDLPSEDSAVLRRLYHVEPLLVTNALNALISLPNVRCEDESVLRLALDWRRDGMDFADALHLASSRAASRFATFDLHTIKSAAKTGLSVSEP